MSSYESIDVNGTTLSFVEKGAGQPVVLIHGILSDYRAGLAQMDALSSSFRTLSYSRRCSYPNQRKDYENSTVENNAEDLAQFLTAKNITARTSDRPLIRRIHSALLRLQKPIAGSKPCLMEPDVQGLIIKDPKSRGEMFSLLLRKPSVVLAARDLINTRSTSFESARSRFNRKSS